MKTTIKDPETEGDCCCGVCDSCFEHDAEFDYFECGLCEAHFENLEMLELHLVTCEAHKKKNMKMENTYIL